MSELFVLKVEDSWLYPKDTICYILAILSKPALKNKFVFSTVCNVYFILTMIPRIVIWSLNLLIHDEKGQIRENVYFSKLYCSAKATCDLTRDRWWRFDLHLATLYGMKKLLYHLHINQILHNATSWYMLLWKLLNLSPRKHPDVQIHCRAHPTIPLGHISWVGHVLSNAIPDGQRHIKFNVHEPCILYISPWRTNTYMELC